MVSRTAMNKDHGLVYRSFIYLFEQLEARKNDATFVVKASYLEIYNEKVKILLSIYVHSFELYCYQNALKIIIIT